MSLMLQEFKADMSHSMKVVLAEAVNLMAYKPPPSVMVAPELIKQSVQQALENNKEINFINSQLGR